MADGKIRVGTELDNNKIKGDMKDLEKMVNDCAKGISKLFKGVTTDDLQQEINDLNRAIKENEQFIKNSEKQIQSYQNKLDNIDADKGMSSIKKEIEQSNKEIEKGKKKIEEYERKLDELDLKKSTITDDVIKNSRIGMNDTDENVDRRVEQSLSKNKDYQKLISQENELVAKIDEYSLGIKNAENNLSTLNKTLANTKETLSDDYSSNIKKLSEETDKARNKIEILSNKLQTLKKNLNIAKESEKTRSSLKDTTKETKNLGNTVAQTTDKGIRKLGRMALAIFSIRTAYTLVSKAANQYLQTNQSMANQVQGIWTTMANVIGPIINTIVGYISTFIGYVNSLIKAFTGVDLIARANASAMKNQAKATSEAGKSAEKAKRQLAGFDEMQVLSNDKSNSDGGGNGNDLQLFTPESVDVSGIASKLEKLFEPFKNAWANYGKGFTDSFKFALDEIWNLVKSIGKSFYDVWTNGTGELTCSLILQILTDVFNIVGNLAKGFSEAWNKAGLGTSIVQHIWNILNNVLKVIKSITKFINELVKKIDWSPILKGLDSILGLLDSLTQSIATFVDEFLGSLLKGDWSGAGKTISDSLISMFDTITEWFANIDWFKLGLDIAKFVADGFMNLIEMLLGVDWLGVIGSIFTLIIEAVMSLSELLYGATAGILVSIWEAITTALSPENFTKFFQGVLDSIYKVFMKIGEWFSSKFNEAYVFICDIFSPLGDWFEQRKQDILNVFSSIGDWFSETFGNAYNAICDIFIGIGDWFSDRYDDICVAFSSIGIWFGEKFDEAYTFITDIFGNVGSWFSDRYKDICNAFSSIGTWFNTKFTEGWNLIKGVFSPTIVTKFFSGVWSNIKSAFGNISEWFRSNFSKAWTAVKNVFSSGGKIFDGIKDGILNGLKACINAIISGINKVIKIPFDGLNSALKSIKKVSILGFKPFDWIGTISVPQIPKLARGGIVNNPTQFIAGEAGKEVVLPLQNNTQWMQDLADFINSQRSEGEGESTINLYIDGEKLFQWFIKRYKKERFVLNG